MIEVVIIEQQNDNKMHIESKHRNKQHKPTKLHPTIQTIFTQIFVLLFDNFGMDLCSNHVCNESKKRNEKPAHETNRSSDDKCSGNAQIT